MAGEKPIEMPRLWRASTSSTSFKTLKRAMKSTLMSRSFSMPQAARRLFTLDLGAKRSS